MKRIFVLVLSFVFPLFLSGQILLDEILQENQIVETSSNSLYYIDFSATWCAPCVHVAKYLAVLQKQNPRNFYIVSLFNEPIHRIEKYLAKKENRLAIALDFNGQTFEKFKVQTLPYGVLMNTKGQVLWKGKAADLNDRLVKKFLRSNMAIANVHSILKVQEKTIVAESETAVSVDGIQLEVEDSGTDNLEILHKKDHRIFRGKLSVLLSYFIGVHKRQVQVDKNLDQYCALSLNHAVNAEDVKDYLLNYFHLNIIPKSEVGDYLTFHLQSDAHLWDCHQYDWGAESADVLLSDTEIKADNLSVKEFVYYIAYAVNKPIVLNSSINSDDLHDWHLHYKYFDLMKQQAWDNYSIKLVEEHNEFPVYRIIKKSSQRKDF
ncbi:TlpA family protein disulfide reductase [Marinifilum caeruleilacunae]|uniref:TlpA family protein disulfide reductase n=1 Tax=Marinifilum caeruleilacunae TaxID=2499076 RepID=A0ABX1WS25_9BACT|nr:TlpA disulfide reductase family protein [Marinifilum caeruleilacunae]NOU58899.1 TlpA family protein disulfide reductase [Marinifilum caeruleilacunae]